MDGLRLERLVADWSICDIPVFIHLGFGDMVRIPSKLFRIKCEPGSDNCDVGESVISKMVHKPDGEKPTMSYISR